jgi:hypothetical protein
MPSVSKKQHNFMAAVAKNPSFAKKVGIKPSVGEEFLKADKGRKFKEGGAMMNKAMLGKKLTNEKDEMKRVGAKARNAKDEMKRIRGEETVDRAKMMGMKKGGMAHSDMAKDKPMMKKVAGEAVKGHEKKMHGMAKGGMAVKKMAKGGGCEIKGKTKGTMIKMKKGGAC